jgi:hypothetical protein
MVDTDLWYLKEDCIDKFCGEFADYSCNINKEETLFINGKPTNILENIVVAFLYKIMDMADLDFRKYKLEYDFIKNSTSFAVNYNKKNKQFSKGSILLNLEKERFPVVFTEIDLETYKFKEYPDENKFKIVYLEPYHAIQHDDDKYFTWFGNSSNKCHFYNVLKITLWEKTKEEVEVDTVDKIENTSCHCIEKKSGDFIEDNLYDTSIFEELFYKKSNGNVKALIEMIEKYKNVHDFLFLNINVKKNIVSLQHLKNKYGLLAEEIYPFSKVNVDINNNSRFYRNKLFKKILSNDVCYWMINEYERKMAQVVKENIPSRLNLNDIPGVLSYIFFVSNLWFEEIKELFDIKELRLNIIDLYLNKYNNTNVDYINSDKPSFLVLNVCLSNLDTYVGGNISLFNNMFIACDEDSVILEQGDMLLTNSKKKIKLSPIESGDIYILTIVSEIIY